MALLVLVVLVLVSLYLLEELVFQSASLMAIVLAHACWHVLHAVLRELIALVHTLLRGSWFFMTMIGTRAR